MNTCKECGQERGPRTKKFCSQSCSAKFNNRGNRRHGKDYFCIQCDIKIARGKYCSNRCQMDYQFDMKIKSGKFTAHTAKKYLLKTIGHVCSSCDLSEWMGNPIPIQIDHIDGNSEDSSLNNVRLLCPNCHAQTPTFGIKNKGNGRFLRRQRYKEGKSR